VPHAIIEPNRIGSERIVDIFEKRKHPAGPSLEEEGAGWGNARYLVFVAESRVGSSNRNYLPVVTARIFTGP
jgi:hypothetical protein